MKLLLFILLPISIFSQDFKLLPDSCVFFIYGTSDGTSHWTDPYSWNYGGYVVNPLDDTLINGNTYNPIAYTEYAYSGNPLYYNSNYYMLGIRQSGNLLYGVAKDSINEYMMMNFDVNVGDTLENIFVTGVNSTGFANAVVDNIDSLQLASGEYQSAIVLNGFEFKDFLSTTYNQEFWSFTWSEYGMSGILGSGPIVTISGGAFDMRYCTSDTLFGHAPFTGTLSNMDCANCILTFPNLSIKEQEKLGVNIVPNPTKGIFQITIKDESWYDKIERVVIYNSVGETIEILKYEKNDSLDLSVYPKGIYLVQLISNETKVSTSKIVIQ
jgi:hypothetical protein